MGVLKIDSKVDYAAIAAIIVAVLTFLAFQVMRTLVNARPIAALTVSFLMAPVVTTPLAMKAVETYVAGRDLYVDTEYILAIILVTFVQLQYQLVLQRDVFVRTAGPDVLVDAIAAFVIGVMVMVGVYGIDKIYGN